MKSVMSHRFSEVPRADIPRSSFDRSHGHKTTLDAGYLVPVFVDEALPGDTLSVRMTGFGRLNTPIFPVMDNMFLDTFFFAVPIRQLWDNWEKFNGAQDNPGDSTDFVMPTMTSTAGTGYANQSLHDYLGIPTQVPGLVHRADFHRAYQKIWDEWFRDQNLQDSLSPPTGDGPDDPADYALLRRGKRHDYFTSALPWPQKGDSVDLPLGTKAPVYGIGKHDTNYVDAGASVYETGASSTRIYSSSAIVDNATNRKFEVEEDPDNAGYPGIYADLTNASAATVNSLRQSIQIQRMLERDARGGTRYPEVILAHFGVTNPDMRMQRSEYLGGGSQRVNISPVAQTSSTDATTPQGNLSGFGTVTPSGHGFTKSFTEHCLVIGMVNIRADLTYQQGLNRMFSRSTRYDHYWPALSHLGEQEILNKEIYAQGSADPTADAAVFGYQERWAEYRYMPSRVSGKFRSNDAQTLDAWHLSQEFGALPVLDTTFIQDDPPIDRVVAVPSEPHMNLDMYFDYRAARPMPLYSVPGLIDHF